MSTETLKFYLSEAGLTNLKNDDGVYFNVGPKAYTVEVTVKRVPQTATITEEQFNELVFGHSSDYIKRKRIELFGAR